MKTSAHVDFENPFAENAPFSIPDAYQPPQRAGRSQRRGNQHLSLPRTYLPYAD